MILTDDNFATIVKAVELGRGLYDNLTKYIRFQMGVLVGFIVTFLGASIFNIVGGVPFVPLQTLYVNFTTQVLQSIGLGYGRPAEGLMKRKPRDSRRADPAAAAPDLGRDRRLRHGRGHAAPHRVGPRSLRLERDRADDGPDVVRVQQRRLLAVHPRRAQLGVLARRARGPDVPALHRTARSPRSCSAPSSGSSSGSSTPSTSTCTSGSCASSSGSRSCRSPRDGGCCSPGVGRRPGPRERPRARRPPEGGRPAGRRPGRAPRQVRARRPRRRLPDGRPRGTRRRARDGARLRGRAGLLDADDRRRLARHRPLPAQLQPEGAADGRRPRRDRAPRRPRPGHHGRSGRAGGGTRPVERRPGEAALVAVAHPARRLRTRGSGGRPRPRRRLARGRGKRRRRPARRGDRPRGPEGSCPRRADACTARGPRGELLRGADRRDRP